MFVGSCFLFRAQNLLTLPGKTVGFPILLALFGTGSLKKVAIVRYLLGSPIYSTRFAIEHHNLVDLLKSDLRAVVERRSCCIRPVWDPKIARYPPYCL